MSAVGMQQNVQVFPFPFKQKELVRNWCINHGCSVCDYFKFFLFSFLHLHRTVSHDTVNRLTLLWPIFLVTQHQYIQPCSVLIYFKQTNKQTSWWLSVMIHCSPFLSATVRHRMNNQRTASCSVVTVYRNIRLGMMSHGGKKLRINFGKKQGSCPGCYWILIPHQLRSYMSWQNEHFF